MRQVERQRGQADPPAAAPAAAASTTQRTTGAKELKPIPTKESTVQRQLRACSGALLDPLTTEASILASKRGDAISGDSIDEAQRMCVLLGAPAAGFILSNGEVTEELQGDVPTSLTGARTGVVSWLKQELNAPATPAREAECASATIALCEQIVALDMTLDPIVARFGGKAPVADQWRAGQPAVRGTEGTWGTVEGELAQTCIERAMRKFGRILHLLMVEIGGAPEPANADLGLEALAQAAEVLKPSLRAELLNEAFSKLATGHRARRLSPAAPAVDGEAIFYRAKAQVPGMLANSQSAESGVQ